jgi:hypothetical protein
MNTKLNIRFATTLKKYTMNLARDIHKIGVFFFAAAAEILGDDNLFNAPPLIYLEL